MAGPEFRERLLPRWWAWLFAWALVAMLAVAYGAALGPAPGLLVGVGGGLLATWLLWISAPVVSVDAQGLRAAGALLPLTSIASVQRVDGAAIRVLRGPGSDARLFVELRPWSAADGVLVSLDDLEDPHPGWLISSRSPARLQAALTAAIDPAGQ